MDDVDILVVTAAFARVELVYPVSPELRGPSGDCSRTKRNDGHDILGGWVGGLERYNGGMYSLCRVPSARNRARDQDHARTRSFLAKGPEPGPAHSSFHRTDRFGRNESPVAEMRAELSCVTCLCPQGRSNMGPRLPGSLVLRDIS